MIVETAKTNPILAELDCDDSSVSSQPWSIADVGRGVRRTYQSKWAMWELTKRGFCHYERTFPRPGVERGCMPASVPGWVLGPRAFSAVGDHVSPCWYQGRSPRGRIRRW